MATHRSTLYGGTIMFTCKLFVLIKVLPFFFYFDDLKRMHFLMLFLKRRPIIKLPLTEIIQCDLGELLSPFNI